MKHETSGAFCRLALLCCLLLLFPLRLSAQETDFGMRVVFFDCGKGDSALLQVGEAAMLIDTGTNKDGKVILSRLHALGIDRLDHLVITHPHKDHVGGADRILDGMEVGQVWEGPLEVDSKQVEQYLESLEARGLDPVRLRAGDSFPLGEATVTCLGPLREAAEDENDLSLVLRVEYRDTSFLFTGDAEREALDDLMAAYSQNGLLEADVLKVPHHGAKERNTPAFFTYVSPGIAFIPCAQGTEDELPDAEVLLALEAVSSEIYIADEGDVMVCSDGVRVWAEQGVFESGYQADAD